MYNKYFQEAYAYIGIPKTVRKQVKKDKNIIYGARAMEAQMGLFARPTSDFDIFSKTPKQSAKKLERNLDKNAGGNYYYYTPSKFHKGTHKVYHKGRDMRKGTKDDIGIADFTTTPRPRPKTVIIQGIKYVHINETAKDKRKSLADPTYSFRHPKDRDDLNRIKTFKKFNRR